LIELRFYRIYDIGWEIDLDLLEKELAESFHIDRTSFLRIKPKSIVMDGLPLSIRMGSTTVEKASMTFEFSVYARIFDIGVISLCLVYDDDKGDYKNLEEIAFLFAEQEGLEKHFVLYLNELCPVIKPYVRNFSVNPEFFEDYTIYIMDHLDTSIDPVMLLAGEKKDFSSQMREEILKSTQSYTKEDRAILSWDSAFLCDPEVPIDLCDLIEFANVLVLELRHYDQELSRQMAKMYEDILLADKLPEFRRRRRYRIIMSHLMQTNTDICEVIEKINNLIKVTEDVYYARVYATMLKVLRSNQWSESVSHKISVIQNNYSMLSDEVRTQHSNFLEWIIIILIAIEIVMTIVEKLLSTIL
jgi:hypothetical protein